MSYEMVSAYTLLVGQADGEPSVSVHSTADDAWRMLESDIRERCGMRPRPKRHADADATARLANAWRAGDPEGRYWNVTAHRLPVPLPVIARSAVAAPERAPERVPEPAVRAAARWIFG